MGNPLALKGLTTSKTVSINNVKNHVPINALTAVSALMTRIDFILSNARCFYLSMGNPLAVKGLIQASRVLVSFVVRSTSWDREYAPSLKWQPYLCLRYVNIVIIR